MANQLSKKYSYQQIHLFENHEQRVKELQDFKELGKIFQSAHTLEPSLARASLHKDYAKLYLYMYDDMNLLMNTLDNKHLEENQKEPFCEYHDQQSGRFEILKYIYQLNNSDKEAQKFENALLKGNGKTFSESLTLKDYKSIFKYSSVSTQALLIKKDLKLFYNSNSDSFFEDYLSFNQFLEKQSYLDKFCHSLYFRIKLWFVSFFYPQVQSSSQLIELLKSSREKNENKFLNSLIHFALNYPEIFKNMLNNNAFLKTIRKIEHFEQKFFSNWIISNHKEVDFETLWSIHEIFAEKNQSVLGRSQYDLLTKSVQTHSDGSENRRYYAQILKNSSRLPVRNIQIDVLKNAFSQQDKNLEHWYENFYKYEVTSYLPASLEDIAFWLAEEKKPLDKKMWNYLILQTDYHTNDEIFDILRRYDLFSLMNFTLDANQKKWIDSLSLDRKINLSLAHRDCLCTEALADIQIPLFAQGMITQDDFKPLLLTALDYKHELIAQQAFEQFEKLNCFEINGQENFVFSVKKLLSVFPSEKLSVNHKLLCHLPFYAQDFTGENFISFLTWFHATDSEHQDKYERLLMTNIENLYLRDFPLDNYQSKLIEHLLLQLNKKNLSSELIHINYARTLIQRIKKADSQRGILEVMLSCDFRHLSGFSKPLREKLAQSLAQQKTKDNSNLLTTLEYWIRYLDQPDLKKLFLSPKQFAQDVLSNKNHNAESLNPINLEYLKYHLTQDERKKIIDDFSNQENYSRQALAFLNSLDKEHFKKVDVFDEAEALCPDLRESALEVDLSHYEEKVFHSLCELESYLLSKVSSYVQHPFLVEDLYRQAHNTFKLDYQDTHIIENLAQQIKDYPFKVPLKYKNYEKVAQDIVLAAWSDKFRELITQGDQDSYHKFLLKLEEFGSVKSRTAQTYLKKLKKSIQKFQKMDTQKNFSVKGKKGT